MAKRARKTNPIAVEAANEILAVETIETPAVPATVETVEAPKKAKEMVVKAEILPEQFSVEAGLIAISMMTAQEKANPAFQHLTEENLKALDKFTTKTINATKSGQKLDKAAQQAAFTLQMNVKRSYTNFFNYYVFEAICVKKGEVPAIVDAVENDSHVEAIIASCRGFVRFRVNRGQGYRLFNLHSYVANIFKPIVRLQKEGLVSSEAIDNLCGFLESLKTLGELYNEVKASPNDAQAQENFQGFLKTFF